MKKSLFTGEENHRKSGIVAQIWQQLRTVNLVRLAHASHPSFTATIGPRGTAFAAPADRPLLLSAELAAVEGLKMGGSCRNGSCRTCMCKLTSGTSRHASSNISLQQRRAQRAVKVSNAGMRAPINRENALQSVMAAPLGTANADASDGYA